MVLSAGNRTVLPLPLPGWRRGSESPPWTYDEPGVLFTMGDHGAPPQDKQEQLFANDCRTMTTAWHTLSPLLIHHRPVHVQARHHLARLHRALLERVRLQLHADARRVWDQQEALAVVLRNTCHHVRFRRPVLPERILLQREVRDARGDLQARRRADRRQRVVWHHAYMPGLGQGSDLLRAGNPAHQAHVRAYILHGVA